MSKCLSLHSSVEQDVEDFLEAKCVRAYRTMPRGSHGRICTKREQMLQFMTAENSISLNDFTYQLTHFVFKVKPQSFQARLYAWVHEKLKNTAFKHCFAGLRLPLRTQYTHVEHEIAMQYLLRHYHEFIDRRRGSIVQHGDSYESGGVLLDCFTREGLENTDEDHEATRKHLESARQELETNRLGFEELKRKLAAMEPTAGAVSGIAT